MAKRIDPYTEPEAFGSTPSKLRRRAAYRRQLAQAVLNAATDTDKVYSHGHGIAKLAAGAFAGLVEGGASGPAPESASARHAAAERRRLAAFLRAMDDPRDKAR